MSADSFDRAKPLYRLFEMDDGSRQWFTVEADNTPGRPLSWDTELVEALVARAPWREDFWQAFARNKKATVYAKPTPAYEVPEGCDAVIVGDLGDYYGERVLKGQIYGDRLGRFRDGFFLHTSKVLSGPDAHGIVRTRNSTYKLEAAGG